MDLYRYIYLKNIYTGMVMREKARVSTARRKEGVVMVTVNARGYTYTSKFSTYPL